MSDLFAKFIFSSILIIIGNVIGYFMHPDNIAYGMAYAALLVACFALYFNN